LRWFLALRFEGASAMSIAPVQAPEPCGTATHPFPYTEGAADINVVMSDDTRRCYFSNDRQINIQLGRKVEEGGELGGPMGGTIGMIIPALIAVGVVALPNLGVVLAGPVAVALAATGVAAVTGGLIAALSDWGIPEERAKQYETGIHDGGILMGVRPRSDEDARHFEQQWRAIGGQHVHS
jgi:hypothetical protein